MWTVVVRRVSWGEGKQPFEYYPKLHKTPHQ
jgi:hypothetical protein